MVGSTNLKAARQANNDFDLLKKISFKNGVRYIGDYEDPPEYSAKAQTTLEKTLFVWRDN